MKLIIQASSAVPRPMAPQCQLAWTSVPTRRRDSRVSAWLLLLLSMACLTAPVVTEAATVWSGPRMVFTKANGADPTQAANQDRLTSHVWLTRGGSRGLYNVAREAFFSHSFSPVDTEWASGTTANYASLTYTDWETWARSVGNPPATPGVNAVLHLKTDDIYLDIKFLSWSQRSGGFSYERSTPGGTADCVFNWAEGAYSNLFAPAGAVSQTQAPYYYRYYAGTNAYLGTSSVDNDVYYLGPATGYTLYDAGPLSVWKTIAGCP